MVALSCFLLIACLIDYLIDFLMEPQKHVARIESDALLAKIQKEDERITEAFQAAADGEITLDEAYKRAGL